MDVVLQGDVLTPTIYHHESRDLPSQPAPSGYPMPFNANLTTLAVHQSGEAVVTVYSVSGKKVAAMTCWLPAGSIYANFEKTGLPNGVYLGKLEMNGQSATFKLIVTQQ
jgi:hypothetical protein